MKYIIYHNNIGNGPGKVYSNLIGGFTILNIPYAENLSPSDISEDDRLIILQSHPITDTKFISQAIVGPNICTLPFDSPMIMKGDYKYVITPAKWVAELYERHLPKEKIKIWPVGIDTGRFFDVSNITKKYDCLIYFKNRPSNDIRFAIQTLEAQKQTYNVIEYGNYNEETFLNLIKESRYAFVIDGTESQGIAIQEMMSCNIPLLVWDTKFWTDRGPEHSILATSVPYWSDACGEKFYLPHELEMTLIRFLDRIKEFNPRKYILDNLSLMKQSDEIIHFF